MTVDYNKGRQPLSAEDLKINYSMSLNLYSLPEYNAVVFMKLGRRGVL